MSLVISLSSNNIRSKHPRAEIIALSTEHNRVWFRVLLEPPPKQSFGNQFR